jgi:hypothetical protein
LSEAYGWTPQQIGEMTMGQVLTYWCELPDKGATKKVEPGQGASIRERFRARRDAWIDNAMRRLL